MLLKFVTRYHKTFPGTLKTSIFFFYIFRQEEEYDQRNKATPSFDSMV